MSTGELVQDSKKAGGPIVFQMGHYQVVKCWDMAAVNMHAGEKIKMFCPAHFANGGAEIYGHFDSFKIPADTDLTYDFEILECDSNIDNLNKVVKKYGVGKIRKKTCAMRRMHDSSLEKSTKAKIEETKKNVEVLKKVKEEVKVLKKKV
jgi:hypothetical protein